MVQQLTDFQLNYSRSVLRQRNFDLWRHKEDQVVIQENNLGVGKGEPHASEVT